MPHHILVTEAGARLALLSCVLRNDGSGWEILNDSGHSPSGITGVNQLADRLELLHAATALKVSSVQVTPDEYLAARAYRCGISVGLATSRIYLYRGTSTTPLSPATVVAASGNLWVTGLMELPPA
ncbi:hypothetical protein GCM10011583_66150 [Streptomyces camponoticapitis]|uniref:Uncharacterized protein n=1 Tax=Streptomyces camponoticapitis TaxID=1616125 RepID=A0ABQ2ESY0_9ACTN|nr:hypothetical protein [Streptomyces camponoticapitis]GGK24852.1 hypothetical protein GCM10011583_66150 [Streptomyces camponoticapitis]